MTLMGLNVAIVAPGEMGAAVAARLVKHGCTVFTNLDDRSPASRTRAAKAGMQDIPFIDIPKYADWVLSILPPSEALNFASSFASAAKSLTTSKERIVFCDCNAVSPTTAKLISDVFKDSNIVFIDAGIIGGPPNDSYNPTIYASADPENSVVLGKFSKFSDLGLRISLLEDGGIGAASALKMSYAGMTKGITGVFATMILAANSASPATSQALLSELRSSQPQLLQRISKSVPSMIPKAYRWVGEMEEISEFVGFNEENIHKGMANLYKRIEDSLERDGRETGDVQILLDFARNAKDSLKDE